MWMEIKFNVYSYSSFGMSESVAPSLNLPLSPQKKSSPHTKQKKNKKPQSSK